MKQQRELGLSPAEEEGEGDAEGAIALVHSADEICPCRDVAPLRAKPKRGN